MDYVIWNILGLLSLAVVVGVSGWQSHWRPNYHKDVPEYLSTKQVFDAENGNSDSFKLLGVDRIGVFIGSKNRLFYLKMGMLKKYSMLHWDADRTSKQACYDRGERLCDNYMRVMTSTDTENVYYICGTYAYQPQCRRYTLDNHDKFLLFEDNKVGIGISPFNPNHNSTAIYVDGKIFSATVSDVNERDPLILLKLEDGSVVRTENRNSFILNEPNFVSSHDKHDKVFFFFRETAVENINCGKAVFSRVARVCKNDRGTPTQNIFTSFFKARLNCSIPGEYPFYFDEIQSTSEFGQGNYRPSSYIGHRSDMVYGVFNTPENGIQRSAVCAFKHSDIEETFLGRFKSQESYLHNWLSVSWDDTPRPHPAMCSNNSRHLPYTSLNFNKRHPMMDKAVPAAGGMPMLVFTSFTSKFTQIAIDWQVLAADGNYYDVMFVGTDDGRIIKAINRGTHKVDSVVIEDIQVLDKGDPVVNLRVMSHRTGKGSRLVVVSRRKVVSIRLHRCRRAKTCRACVSLQDPYCVWDENLKCINAQRGLQNILSGEHTSCEKHAIVRRDVESINRSRDKINEMWDKLDEGLVSASITPEQTGLAIEIVIVAVIVSIIGSLILGFFMGFTFQACRYARERDNVFCNRLSSGDNPYFHTDHSNLPPKQMTNVVNPGKINSMETKPMTKANRLYL